MAFLFDSSSVASSCAPVLWDPMSQYVMHLNLVNSLKAIVSPSADLYVDPILEGPSSMEEEALHPAVMTAVNEAAVVSIDLIKNRRPFICDYIGCGKTFKNTQTLKMHSKTHSSHDPVHQAGASSTGRLKSSKSSNKKTPSGCPICGQTFVGLYELRRHFGRRHSQGEKQFGCTKCGKKFFIQVDKRDHEKLCGNSIECICGMKFAFKCNLVVHKRGHPECQDHPLRAEGQYNIVTSGSLNDYPIQSGPLSMDAQIPNSAAPSEDPLGLKFLPNLPLQPDMYLPGLEWTEPPDYPAFEADPILAGNWEYFPYDSILARWFLGED